MAWASGSSPPDCGWCRAPEKRGVGAIGIQVALTQPISIEFWGWCRWVVDLKGCSPLLIQGDHMQRRATNLATVFLSIAVLASSALAQPKDKSKRPSPPAKATCKLSE